MYDSSSQLGPLQAQSHLLAARLLEDEVTQWRFPSLYRMAHCSHLGNVSHCGLRLCPSCERWRNERDNLQLKSQLHRLHSEGKTRYLFATATVEDVKTDSIRDTAKHISSSWNGLMKGVHGWKGDFRVTEISPNPTDPTLEHVHAHGIIAVSPSAYSGRYYRSKKVWPEAWNKDWERAKGETASTIFVKRVTDIDEIYHIVDYCRPFDYEGKKGWLQQTQGAIANPQRYLERHIQLRGLQKCRYKGELDLKQLRAGLSDETGLFSGYTNSKWRNVERKTAYECDSHRKRPPKLLPIASKAACTLIHWS